MTRRTNHPLKTLFLLAVVAALGWGAYKYLYLGGVLRSEVTEFDIDGTSEKVREAIFQEFESDLCLQTMDEVSYRANEDHFRIRVTISDDCRDTAREICERIADVGSEATGQTFGVFAYDRGGSLMARFIQ